MEENNKEHELENEDFAMNNSKIYRNYETLVAMDVDEKIKESEDRYKNKITINHPNEIYKEKKEILKLIPKYTNYMEYMLDLLIILPRVEKFNIGNAFKNIMYETLENIMYLDKIENKSKMYYLNKIDAEINIQRVYLRIMVKHNWISLEKFNIVMLEQLSEIGRILGGLVKFYAKNNKK